MTEQTGNNKPNEAEGLAFPLSGNEKLIEEARRLPDQYRVVQLSETQYLEDQALAELDAVGYQAVHTASRLADALEVAEKALTPTDDEVEALRIAHLDARQAAYRKEREDWFVDHEAEPEIATNAFFRGWDAAVGGGFRRSEVLPEPSTDAGVDDAWWKAQEAGQLPRTPGPSIRQAFKAGYRAALRAAGGVR